MTDQRLEVEVLDLKRRVAALEHSEPRKPREWVVIEMNGHIFSQYSGQFKEYIKVREVIE